MRSAGFFLLALFAACERTPDSGAPPAQRYGPLMIESGYRLQVLGRAATARNWELAAHESKRLRELFALELPRAAPPEDAVVEVLLARSRGLLRTRLPALDAALAARDPAAFSTAYRGVVDACNGCHAGAGFEPIVIPHEPGAPFPRTDPPGGVPSPP